MDYLCPLVAIFLIVSLIGHGFWLFVSVVIRALSSDDRVDPPNRWCSHCRVKLKPHAVRCPSCNELVPQLRKEYFDDLKATRRQLMRLRDEETLEPDEATRLLKLLQDAADPNYAAKLKRRNENESTADPATTTAANDLKSAKPASQQVEEQKTSPDPLPTVTPATFSAGQKPTSPAKPVEPGPTMKQLRERDKSDERPKSAAGISPVAPTEPGRSFGELLAAFMEDRNIRWGELVSSVLIVGCSIGLVISLWSTLESIPYFPALLFLMVTAAIHGAGLYTLRRWRLKTTSRGLLTIAQLLIPLNFLAAIALSNRGTMRSLGDPLVLGAIAVGCAVFGAISISGSRVLSRPFKWWPLALAALLPSLGQIAINRTITVESSSGQLILLGLIPIAGFVTACAGQLAEARFWSRLTRRRTIQLLRVAGIGTFASLIPLGLLCWKSENIRDTLGWLSPLISVATASTLAIGLRIHRDAIARHLSQFRTGGTGLSIFSGLLMAACLAIAWPHPGLLIAIGLTNFGILIALARISGFMGLLVPAIESVALAVVIATHLATETLTTGGDGIAFQTAAGGSYTPSLLTILLLGRSGILLQLGTIVTLGVAFFLKQKGHSDAAKSTAIGGAGLLVGSIVACGNAALNFGTQTPLDVNLATLGLLINAIAVLAAAVFARNSVMTGVGSALILATISHGLFVNTAVEELLQRISLTHDHPLVVSLLAHGFLMSFFAFASHRWLSRSPTTHEMIDTEAVSQSQPKSIRNGLVVPAVLTGLTTATLTLPWTLFAANEDFLTRAGYSVIVSAAWLICSLALPIRQTLIGIQLTGTATVSLLMLGLSQYRDWWTNRASDPRAILSVTFGLTLWSGLWSTLRIRFRQSKLGELLEMDSKNTVDRILAAVTIVMTCAIVWTACGQSLFGPPQGPVSLPGSAPLLIIAGLGLLASAIHLSTEDRGQEITTSGELRAGSDGFWRTAPLVMLIALPLFLRWADSSANAWHAISGYGTSLEFWLALPAVTAAALLHLRDRSNQIALSGTFCCLATAPAALSLALPGPSAAFLGTGLAGFCAAIPVTAWQVQRSPTGSLANFVRSFIPKNFGQQIEQRSIAFLAAPAAVVSLVVAGRAILYSGGLNDNHEPALSTLTYLSFLFPLIILAAVSVFTAYRKQRAEHLLSGSLLWSAAAMLLYLVLAFDRRLVSSEVTLIVQAVQAVGVAAVLYVLSWQLADWRWPMTSASDPVAEDALDSSTTPELATDTERPSSRLHSHPVYLTPLEWQHRLVRILALAPAAWATVLIFGQPTFEYASVVGQSQLAGIITVLLAAILMLKSRPRPTGEEVVSILTTSVLALFAYSAISQYPSIISESPWRVFHFLSGGWLTTAAVAACVVWFSPRWFSVGNATGLTEATRTALDDTDLPATRAAEDRWLPPLETMFAPLITASFVVGCCVLGFALRSLPSDPFAPTSTSLLALGTAAVFAIPALRARRQSWAYRSAVVSVAAFCVLWIQPLATAVGQWTVEFTTATATAAAVTAGFWLLVSIFWQRRTDSVFDPRAKGISLPKFFTLAALAAAFSAAMLALVSSSTTIHATPFNADFFPSPLSVFASHMGHVMLGSLVVLLTATLWDKTATWVIPCFFALPALGTLIYLDAIPNAERPAIASIAAAVHIVLASILLASRASWFPRLEKIGVWNNDRNATETRGWLPIAAIALTLLVTVLALRSSLLPGTFTIRLTPPVCLAVLALSLGFLADACRTTGGSDHWFANLRVGSLVWLSLAFILFIWGCSDSGLRGDVWLLRSIRVLEVLSVATFLLTLPGIKLTQNVDRWRGSLRIASSIHGALALASLAVVLILEGVFFEKGTGSPVTGMQIAVVAGVLVGLAAGLIAMAVNPEPDPLNLNEQQRQYYVYAAEALGGLLFLHIYLTMPELFSGRIRPYWPLIVMTIAFVGAGVGEILRRFGHVVIAEPLQRTGTLLPLLPALGFWMVTPRSDLAAAYSTELFAAGLVYVFLSMWRKSYVHIVLAAVLGNAGLWAMWHELDLELIPRPQLWLIPPALSTLFAAHLNRDRLTASQISSIRYASVTLIYVSSTGEMFIAGIGENLWLPIILATFSLVGIFSGILLRVRAFLYLGSSFLLLSVVSMVWHAARSLNEVWPWWVFGIATGIGMLALFGVFEKRRNDMLKIVSQLRTWEK